MASWKDFRLSEAFIENSSIVFVSGQLLLRQDFLASGGSHLCEEGIHGIKIDRMSNPRAALSSEVKGVTQVYF